MRFPIIPNYIAPRLQLFHPTNFLPDTPTPLPSPPSISTHACRFHSIRCPTTMDDKTIICLVRLYVSSSSWTFKGHRSPCIHKLQFQPIVGDDYQSGVCTLPRQHWPSQSVQSMSMTMSPPMLYTGLGVVTRTCPATTLLAKDVEARIPAQCCIQSQKDGKMSTPIVMAKRESSVWHFCRSRTSHVWTIISSLPVSFLESLCTNTRWFAWSATIGASLECMDQR